MVTVLEDDPGLHLWEWNTFPETNMAPENEWLEYDRFLLVQAYFQVLC